MNHPLQALRSRDEEPTVDFAFPEAGRRRRGVVELLRLLELSDSLFAVSSFREHEPFDSQRSCHRDVCGFVGAGRPSDENAASEERGSADER